MLWLIGLSSGTFPRSQDSETAKVFDLLSTQLKRVLL